MQVYAYLHVCMYACVHVCMCVCVCILDVCMHACMRMHITMYACLHVCVRMHISMYACMHACMHVCVHAAHDNKERVYQLSEYYISATVNTTDDYVYILTVVSSYITRLDRISQGATSKVKSSRQAFHIPCKTFWERIWGEIRTRESRRISMANNAPESLLPMYIGLGKSSNNLEAFVHRPRENPMVV
jgi:hypothetical protein